MTIFPHYSWAGEPHAKRRSPRGQRRRIAAVYPRVGGGTPKGCFGRVGGGMCKEIWSIPAWAGEPLTGLQTTARVLSPRGRGNPVNHGVLHSSSGSIPAWAGEPGLQGGDVLSTPGLSPRGRGNHDRRCNRSIPVGRGNPLDRRRAVYPRVGGGTSFRLLAIKRAWAGEPCTGGLSPRGRGNRISMIANCRITRCTVYPRVGGGTDETPILM